jgi:hypothetical protein
MIANCRVYAQFVNNTLIIMSLTNKDNELDMPNQ